MALVPYGVRALTYGARYAPKVAKYGGKALKYGKKALFGGPVRATATGVTGKGIYDKVTKKKAPKKVYTAPSNRAYQSQVMNTMRDTPRTPYREARYARTFYKGRNIGGKGSYVGKFNRRMKKKKPSEYEKKGHCTVTQKHGTQIQSHCAWIGFRSAISDQVMFDMAVSLVRHIYYKHYGYTFNHLNQPTNNSSQRAIVDSIKFVYKNNDDDVEPILGNVSIDVNATTVAALSENIRDNVLQSNAFNGYSDGSTSHRRFLVGYYITERDYRGVTATDFVLKDGPFQDIENMYVKAYANAQIAIQNVTAADDDATGTPLDRNRVDANPIVGKLYKFSVPLPMIKADSTTNDLNGIQTVDNEYVLCRDPKADGVLFPQEDLQGPFQRPVPQTMFKKCSGAAKARLEPGAIKRAKLSFTFDGKLNNLMHGFFDGQGDPRIKDSLGTCMLFAFEKTMRTGNSDTIDINWQVSRRTGAVVKKTVKPVMGVDYVPETETTTN